MAVLALAALGMSLVASAPAPHSRTAPVTAEAPRVSAGGRADVMCFVAGVLYVRRPPGVGTVVIDGFGCPAGAVPLVAGTGRRLSVRAPADTQRLEVSVVLPGRGRLPLRLHATPEGPGAWSTSPPPRGGLALVVAVVTENGRRTWELPLVVPRPPPRGRARLIGEITRSGGPLGRETLSTAGRVALVDSSGRTLARAHTNTTGRFSFVVPRGHYRLRADAGRARCRSRFAIARPGQVTWTPIRCRAR